MEIRVIQGDITREPSDGLITAINGGGLWLWNGGVDRAIRRAAGDQFHEQADNQMPLAEGRVIFATKFFGGEKLAFDSVIFVVDNLQRPLREVVFAGLQEAERQRLAVVTLPSLRTGVMEGVYEPTVEAALDETVAALMQFVASQPHYVQKVTVVVYNDPKSVAYLQRKLQTA